MCGIVGAASRNLVGSEVKNFEDLMIVSNLRGKVGAGVIIVKDDKVRCVKTPYSGIDAIELKAYGEQVWTSKGTLSALVGHTRFPTKGGTDLEAVHPHSLPNLAGVHNGTLEKVRNKRVDKDTSDSFKFYEHVNEVGVIEALKDAEGAYALVFVDYATKKLNFIRNYQRPLFFAKVNWFGGGRTLYWASEKAFLQLVLGRNNVKFEIEELPVNELWTIPVSMNEDFTKETHVYSNIRSWTPKQTEGADAHWYDDIPFRQSQRSSFVTLPSKVGPEFSKIKKTEPISGTYVVRGGNVIRKGHDEKQVTLPRTSADDEPKGATKDEVPVGKTDSAGGVSDKQRAKVDAKISDRKGASNRGSEVKRGSGVPLVPRHLLSPAENALNDDLSDMYPTKLSSPLSDEEVEAQFEKMFKANQEALNKDSDSDLIQTVKGHFVELRQYKRIFDHGCAYCGNSKDYATEKASWLDQTQFLCEDCQSSEEALNVMLDFHPNAEIMDKWREGKLTGMNPPADKYNHDGTFSSTDPRVFH